MTLFGALGNGACNKISACSESDARIIVPFVWFDQPSGHHEGDDDVADTTLSTEFDLLTVMLLLGITECWTLFPTSSRLFIYIQLAVLEIMVIKLD